MATTGARSGTVRVQLIAGYYLAENIGQINNGGSAEFAETSGKGFDSPLSDRKPPNLLAFNSEKMYRRVLWREMQTIDSMVPGGHYRAQISQSRSDPNQSVSQFSWRSSPQRRPVRRKP